MSDTMDIVNRIESKDEIVKKIFDEFNLKTVNRPSVEKFINDALTNDADVPIIMSTIFDKFTIPGTIFTKPIFKQKEFTDVICKADGSNHKIRGYNAFLTEDQYNELEAHYNDLGAPEKISNVWRITYTLFNMCKYPDCDINQILTFEKDYNTKVNKYKSTQYDLQQQLNALNNLKISGGNQKGGDIAQIATLLAGIDNVVSRIINDTSNVTSQTSEAISKIYEGLCNLCKKAADAIYAIPGCLRSLMGDTLYALLKNIVKGAIGAGAMQELYNSGDVFLAVLNSIAKYLPYVAGSVVFYGTGLAFFKLTEKIATIIPSINTDLQTKFTTAVETIDESTIDDVVTKMNEMQNAVVEKITTKLQNARESEKENIENAMNEFNEDFRNMFEHLSPAANAEVAAKMAEITTNSEAMVKKIKANLEATQKKQDIWNQGAKIEADARAAAEKIEADARAAAAQIEADKRAAAKKKEADEKVARLSMIDALKNPSRLSQSTGKKILAEHAENIKREKLLAEIVNKGKDARAKEVAKIRAVTVVKNMDAMDDTNGGKPRRKTTRKPHKKPHKKSRKHRRSRKH